MRPLDVLAVWWVPPIDRDFPFRRTTPETRLVHYLDELTEEERKTLVTQETPFDPELDK